MATGSITLLKASPDMLRYYFADATGAAQTKKIADLIADSVAGPLRSLLTQLSAVAWPANMGALSDLSPVKNSKLSVYLVPHVSDTGYVANAAYELTGDAVTPANNTLTIMGGTGRLSSSIYSAYTSVIVEIRYNHSISR